MNAPQPKPGLAPRPLPQAGAAPGRPGAPAHTAPGGARTLPAPPGSKNPAAPVHAPGAPQPHAHATARALPQSPGHPPAQKPPHTAAPPNAAEKRPLPQSPSPRPLPPTAAPGAPAQAPRPLAVPPQQRKLPPAATPASVPPAAKVTPPHPSPVAQTPQLSNAAAPSSTSKSVPVHTTPAQAPRSSPQTHQQQRPPHPVPPARPQTQPQSLPTAVSPVKPPTQLPDKPKEQQNPPQSVPPAQPQAKPQNHPVCAPQAKPQEQQQQPHPQTLPQCAPQVKPLAQLPDKPQEQQQNPPQSIPPAQSQAKPPSHPANVPQAKPPTSLPDKPQEQQPRPQILPGSLPQSALQAKPPAQLPDKPQEQQPALPQALPPSVLQTKPPAQLSAQPPHPPQGRPEIRPQISSQMLHQVSLAIKPHIQPQPRPDAKPQVQPQSLPRAATQAKPKTAPESIQPSSRDTKVKQEPQVPSQSQPKPLEPPKEKLRGMPRDQPRKLCQGQAVCLPSRTLFGPDGVPYSALCVVPPSQQVPEPAKYPLQPDDVNLLGCDMEDSAPSLDGLVPVDGATPLFLTYDESSVVTHPLPVSPYPEEARSSVDLSSAYQSDHSPLGDTPNTSFSGTKKTKARPVNALVSGMRRGFKTLLRKSEGGGSSNNSTPSVASASPSPSLSVPGTPSGLSQQQPSSSPPLHQGQTSPTNPVSQRSMSPGSPGSHTLLGMPDDGTGDNKHRRGFSMMFPSGADSSVSQGSTECATSNGSSLSVDDQQQKTRAESFHVVRKPAPDSSTSSSISSPLVAPTPVSSQRRLSIPGDVVVSFAEALDPGTLSPDLVYVYVAYGGRVVGFSYPSDWTTKQLIAQICTDAQLPAGEYILGISAINLFMTTDDDRPIRRISFFQMCNKLGISPSLELFARPASPPVAADLKVLAECVWTNYLLSRRALGDTYMSILEKFRVETMYARRQFLLTQRQLNEQSIVQGKARAVGITNEQLLYLREEQTYAYKDEGIRIPNAERAEFTVQAVPYNMPVVINLKVRGDITVSGLMSLIFAEGRKVMRTLDATDGTQRKSQCSVAGDLFTSDPSACVLKVMGWKEYIIPCSECNEYLRLDSYEYVRKMYTAKSPLAFTIYPRTELHCVPEYTQAQQADQYAEQLVSALLTRDIWRENEHITDCIPFSTLRFSMNIDSARQLPVLGEGERGVYISAALCHGGIELASPTISPVVPYCVSGMSSSFGSSGRSDSGDASSAAGAGGSGGVDESEEDAAVPSYERSGTATWRCQLEFGVSGKRIPREARVCLTVYACEPGLVGQTPATIGDKHTPIGWFDFLLFDHFDVLRTGEFGVFLWPGKANPIGTCMSNGSTSTDAQGSTIRNPYLRFTVEPYTKPVKFVPYEPSSDALAAAALEPPKGILAAQDITAFKEAISVDMLTPLKPEHARVLWEYRDLIRKSKPRCLPQLLRAVDWTITDMVYQVHKMLEEWKPLNPFNALELLDSKFADTRVRSFAVRCLESMSDAECAQLLLQLIQVLKYEPYHVSPLANFLLHRALRSPYRIGQPFFWGLMSEIHCPDVSERFGILLEMYLRLSGQQHREEILGQVDLLSQLEGVAREIKTVPKETRLRVLRERLSTVSIPRPVSLPLDARFSVGGLIVDKCKYMDSKKLPLWLVFTNADTSSRPVYVLFKVGDDIRQDILTLQMMRMMDMLWKKQGKDLRMQLYRAVATGDSVGMIEVVLDSDTTANIAKERGGASAVLAEGTIRDWLAEKNPTPQAMADAVETFILSCAGYCVATYVLGIGDRHSDNVMVSVYGHFFHIDFGHFLGNFKSKLGVKRERTPFKFTPQFACVFGGKGSPGYNQFVDVCCEAYNMLRHNGDLFITLFGLMLSTGIPELQTKEDISYLQLALMRDLDDVSAAEKFRGMIDDTLHSSSQTINDMFHHWVHR